MKFQIRPILGFITVPVVLFLLLGYGGSFQFNESYTLLEQDGRALWDGRALPIGEALIGGQGCEKYRQYFDTHGGFGGGGGGCTAGAGGGGYLGMFADDSLKTYKYLCVSNSNPTCQRCRTPTMAYRVPHLCLVLQK